MNRRFAEVVGPFLKANCLDCHGERKQEAKLDLSRYASVAAVVKDHRVWETILERLEAEEMPPAKAPRQPRPDERRTVIEWIRELRADEARRNAGDPGPVPARRLSNAEFDYTIRDLTGVDIRPAREFPVDPANEAGFDNSGESLVMSPALLKKYLGAARLIADYVVLKPAGFVFAPHPVVTDTDRDKYCVQRIIDFYQRHPVDYADYADYFLAAWRFHNRDSLGKPQARLEDFASESHLSPKYLATLWSALNDPQPEQGPLGEVRAQWRKISGDSAREADIRRDCAALRDLVVKLRKELAPQVEKLHAKGISDGSQSFVLWRNRRLASLHQRYTGAATGDEARGFEVFCRVFPDAFVITDRGLYSDPKGAGQGRPLTAGFHLMQGFFRDDAPLCEMVLNENERQEIDALWLELNFITRVPLRQYKDFIFFERAEPPRYMFESDFDFARSEDKDATSKARIEQLREAYLAKARKISGVTDEALEAIATYFRNIAAEIRQVEDLRLAAEPSHLDTLTKFAARAWRRPLTPAEQDQLTGFYRSLRKNDELNHEDAIRDSLASVLLSPQFCYRLDLAADGPTPRPLSDFELASRLSYFLWSSMPDAELLAHAAAGDLHLPAVLVPQTRRMLQADRARALAVEFGGNWLEFRRFEEHNAVDRERFPNFTNELRQAMFEEPVRFFTDLLRRNGSILDFLYADHTFVNAVLAKHYGLAVPEIPPGEWVRVDGVTGRGRGGLLPMAVFLTRNSPGLRTSPVKRGYWVVRRLLGEQIHPPPPEVPELPKDESKLGELTLPQVLARHRDHKACAGCHQHFDSLGLTFEGYGPVGELRELDLGGRPVQTQAVFPDGSEGVGVAGLKQYLAEKRQADFIDNLCRKLLAYGLGRTLLLSDQAALENMRTQLVADGYRFAGLVESIVTSPQFLNKRGRDDQRE